MPGPQVEEHKGGAWEKKNRTKTIPEAGRSLVLRDKTFSLQKAKLQ